MSVLSQFAQSQNTDFPNVRPSLDLRFALAKKLDPRVAFARASTATYIGPDGTMRTAGVNEPRFDHDPITGQSLGLLIEENRTNLLTYSEDFSQGVWTKHNSSINSNVITAPDNTSNATKLIENTSNVQHMVYRNLTSAVNTTYTFSFFAKSAERQYVLASFSGGGLSGDCVVGVSLIDGSVTTTSNSPENTSVTKLPNGWYRITLTKTTPSASAFQPRILISRTGSSSQTYQADGTSGIYVWGAQLEAGAFPTSFIPTFGSQVTRSADNASMTGTNFSSWFNQTEGTVYADLRDYKSSSVGNFGISIGSASNNYFAFPYISSSGSLANGVFWKETALAKTIDFPNGGAGGKYAISYKNAQSFYGYLNGNRGDAEAPPYPNPVGYNELYIGRGHFSPTKYQNFYIRRLTYYPLALTDKQLINLTSEPLSGFKG